MEYFNGIDVSQHQGVIDWNIVKDQVDFVILRCGYGQNREDQDDTQFYRNADTCTRLGIPFGVYLYSYAQKPEDAIGEAEHVLRLLRGYTPKYPVYYALEDENTTGKQSHDTIAAIADTFCSILEEHAYYVGIYAKVSWWTEKLTSPIFNKYSRWVASGSEALDYPERHDIWKYAEDCLLDGIQGPVSVNCSYRDFERWIPSLGIHGFSSHGKPIEGKCRYQIGDTIYFNYVFLTSESTTPLLPYKKIGTITRIVPSAKNPYLVGKDQGWVNMEVIEGEVRYLGNPNYVGGSFMNALAQIHESTSFENRRHIASLNGITNYQGTIQQNEVLLSLLRQGELVSY